MLGVIRLSVLAIFIFIAALGCANRQAITCKSNPATRTVSNSEYSISVTPSDVYTGSFGGWLNGLELSVKNNTDKNIEINWNKTLFVASGQTSGSFMFEGIMFAKRDEQKVSDVVFSGGIFNRTVFPNTLVTMINGAWFHDSMRPGENGIYLTLVLDGKEISEKVTVDISCEKKGPATASLLTDMFTRH